MLDQLITLFLAEGFLRFSLGDLAERLKCSKSTLYAVAPSKEQIIAAAVREFFRRAAARVESTIAGDFGDVARIGAYLESIAAELAPASPEFFADVDAFEPAREIYRQNTRIAAQRVQDLVRAAVPADAGGIDPTFIGAVAGQVMEAIHRGEIESATGLDDSAAYRALAELIGPRLPATLN